MINLNLPYSDEDGYTPASCRSGGATFRFHAGQPLPSLFWDARWRNHRMAEFYLHEVAALSVLPKLDPRPRDRLLRLAAAADFELDAAARRLRLDPRT